MPGLVGRAFYPKAAVQFSERHLQMAGTIAEELTAGPPNLPLSDAL